ncbi:MAG: hypothetical protein ACJ8AW_19265 [Rhodopila sp.]
MAHNNQMDMTNTAVVGILPTPHLIADAMKEAAIVGWLTIDPNFWNDLVRFATPGAVLLVIAWVLFR